MQPVALSACGPFLQLESNAALFLFFKVANLDRNIAVSAANSNAAHSIHQCKAEECNLLYNVRQQLSHIVHHTAVSCYSSLYCILLSSAALPVTSNAIDTVLLTTKQAPIHDHLLFIIINSAIIIVKFAGIRTHPSKDLIQP